MPDDRIILKAAPNRLLGERIVVRSYTDEDAEELHEAIQESTEHLRPWMPWYNQHATVADTLDYLRRAQAAYLLREDFSLGIFSHEGRFLGSSGIHVRDWNLPSFEIGYWIRQSEEGKGYITEAASLLTVWAFETHDAKRLIIRCFDRNVRSAAVAERLGYTFEGTMRNLLRDPAGDLVDMRCYSMLPEEYRRQRTRW